MKLPISYWESIIKKGIEQGLSGRAILEAARSEGLKIRTQTFYEIYNSVRLSMDFEKIIEKIPEDRPISDRYLPKRDISIPTKYAYIVKIETDIIEFNFGIYSDKPLSKKEIYEQAQRVSGDQYKILPVLIRIIRAYRRAK